MQPAVCREGEAYLNTHATWVAGEQLTFYVHYWGATPAHFDNPVHRHSFYEVCYVVDGAGTYIDDGITYSLRPGTLFFSRPGVWHQICSGSGMVLLFVAFELQEEKSDPAAARNYQTMASSGNFYVFEACHTTTGLIWEALLRQAAVGQPYRKQMVLSLCHTLLTSFFHAFSDTVDTAVQKEKRVRSASSLQLYQAQLFIRDNLSQPLLLDDVAGYLHMSGRHLSRLFSEELGQSFSAYIKQERLRQAVSMLTTTNLSIKTIAGECGYETVHYFTRVFSREMGISPARFRERSLEES